jgi:hypothetical protein
MMLNVGHKAAVVALLPEPETLVKVTLDVSGSTDSSWALQNARDEDECLLGIAFALPDGTEEFHQRGQEALADPALRDGVRCRGNTGHVTPVFLEELVVHDATIQMCSGVIMEMAAAGNNETPPRIGEGERCCVVADFPDPTEIG